MVLSKPGPAVFQPVHSGGVGAVHTQGRPELCQGPTAVFFSAGSVLLISGEHTAPRRVTLLMPLASHRGRQWVPFFPHVALPTPAPAPRLLCCLPTHGRAVQVVPELSWGATGGLSGRVEMFCTHLGSPCCPPSPVSQP